MRFAACVCLLLEKFFYRGGVAVQSCDEVKSQVTQFASGVRGEERSKLEDREVPLHDRTIDLIPMGWRAYREPYRRWRDVKDVREQPGFCTETLEIWMKRLLFRESWVPSQLRFIGVRTRGYKIYWCDNEIDVLRLGQVMVKCTYNANAAQRTSPIWYG